jgi:septal ring factor EnvC (AmiA/AmiB activator)
MNRLLFLVFFFTLSSFSLAAVNNYDQEIKEYDQGIRNKQSEIQKLQKEIEKLKKVKEKSKSKEENYRQEIKKIEEEIGLLDKEIKKFEQAKKETEKNIRITEGVYQDTEKERINLAEVIKKEINFFYLRQKFYSQPKENYYLLTLLKQKEDFYQVTERKKKDLEKEKETLFLKKKEIESEKEKKQTEGKERKNIKKDKQILLVQTEEERIKAEKEIENLKKASTDLEKLIFSLEKKKKDTEEAKRQAILAREDFAAKKGYLPWPVEGETVVKFGRQKHPEFNTYVVNNGIKIRPRGEKKVNAIAQGKVVYAAEFQTYGKTIILDHDGGFYTVYGSLGEILVKEGKEVILGEQIAHLANEPLYFELRDQGQPTDPLIWLRK